MSGWRKRVPRAKRRRSGYRASMTTEHLMIQAAALKRLIDATPPGMPRLSGTARPAPCAGSAVSMGTACTRTVAIVIWR